jgi:serine/threonine-protein kinase
VTQLNHIGRYQIVKELGRGAMGVVFQAVDPTIGRTVAIKTIRLGEVNNPQERAKLRERLFREARSAGILSHPNIVTIYDMQEEGDLTYIAMEFVDGPTLDALMSANEPIKREEVLRILKEAASGLDYAHQKRIVHRDIKPANIMLDNTGKVKITDFGIAKVSSSEQFTMTGTIVGTPNYMSPEQVQGLPTVDGRADQFSLCVIAFEMLTGEKPFTGEHLTTVVYKIVAGDPIPPRRLNPTLGPEIEGILRKGLAKQPDGRFLSCLEFVNALDRACAVTKGWTNLTRGASQDMPTMGGDPPALQTPPPAPGRPPLAPRPERPPMPAPAKRARPGDTTVTGRERRRMSGLTVLLAILVAAGLVGLIAWQAAPWLIESGKLDGLKPTPAPQTAQQQQPIEKPNAGTPAPTPVPREEPKPPETTTPEATKPEATAPTAPTPKPEAEEPVPEPPKPVEPPQPKPDRKVTQPRRPQQAEVLPQALGIVTNPPGALAALDGHSANSCRTPCTLTAPPGKHFIEITRAGYETEHRQVEVTSGPQDLPPIVMRALGGTLMLSSNPQGATITIDGKQQDKLTPAQLNLPPGTYTIVVAKDGKSQSQTVQIQNGVIKTMKVDFRAE